MRSRVGIRQETVSIAKPRRYAFGEDEQQHAPKKRRHQMVPYCYKDLDLDVPSDDEALKKRPNEIYYRGVLVAQLCLEIGGWCRADRQAAPRALPILLGYGWLNFEDRKKLQSAVFRDADEDDSVSDLRLTPFAFQSSNSTSQQPYRYFHSVVSRTLDTDDTWLYEKLELFKSISRSRGMSDYQILQLQKEAEALPEEEDRDDCFTVRSHHAYLRQRVRSIGSVLYQQLKMDRLAMAGDLEKLFRAAAFYLLSCSKTEGSSSVRQICKKQIELLEHFSERWTKFDPQVKPIIAQLHLFEAIYVEDITIEDMAFQLKKDGCPLRALITPPVADTHNIGIERFVESVIYRQLVKIYQPQPPRRTPPRGYDEVYISRLCEIIRSLFLILIRHGDMIMLLTALNAILSKLLGLTEIRAFHCDIEDRLKTECHGVSEVRSPRSSLTEMIRADDPEIYPWLIQLLKFIPSLSAAPSSVWLPLLRISPIWQSDVTNLYSQILSLVALEEKLFFSADVHTWLKDQEIIEICRGGSIPRVHQWRRRMRAVNLDETARESCDLEVYLAHLIARSRIKLTVTSDCEDWSDTSTVVTFIYGSISTNLTIEEAEECLKTDGRSLLELWEQSRERLGERATGAHLWSVFIMARILDIDRSSVGSFTMAQIDSLLESLSGVADEVVIRLSWFKWCRLLNKNMSFYFRFRRTFDDFSSYNRSLNFFITLIQNVDPDSQFGEILNGSINARFSAQDITALANFWCQLLSSKDEAFWVDLDLMLVDFALKSGNEYALNKYSRATPYFALDNHLHPRS